MRITSGQFKGRILKAPAGAHVRPTADKVRQAIFNILLQYGHPNGSVVLDAFCGSGALGIEALSRGAAHCTMMDIDRASIQQARANIDMLGLDDQTVRLLRADATHAPDIRTGGTPAPDLIFLDPPYRKGLIAPALFSLKKGGWIADDAIIVAESESEWPPNIEGFEHCTTRTYGDTSVHIFTP